jgi:hypothetical protein
MRPYKAGEYDCINQEHHETMGTVEQAIRNALVEPWLVVVGRATGSFGRENELGSLFTGVMQV